MLTGRWVQRMFENKHVNVGEAEYTAVRRVLDARQLAGTAPIVDEYEDALSGYFGGCPAVAVSSGTAALHALLMAREIGRDDEVILPPTAPVMSVLPIVAVGATPVFADTGAFHFGLDSGAVTDAITSATRAIVTVPMWGYPANGSELRTLADSRGLLLIEDASHCHGAMEGPRPMGTTAHASFFSTQERKLIATGEGGFIITRDAQLVKELKAVRDFGKLQSDVSDDGGRAGQYGYGLGLNFRISAIAAALGIAQLSHLDARIVQRTTNARAIAAQVRSRGFPMTEWVVATGSRPNYYSLVLRARSAEVDMRAVGSRLEAHGVISDLHRFGATMLYDLPAFSKYRRHRCPNAEEIFASILTLPTHEGLGRKGIQHVVESLADAVAEGKAP